MFLTNAEIKELTGYTRKTEQAKALARSSYEFEVREKDGKLLVLRSYIERKFGGKPTKSQKKAYQLNENALRKHCA